MTTVYLDGRFLDPAEARVSAFDAGLQHGVGLFETFLGGVRGDTVWAHHLEDHLARLIESARDLGLADLRAGPLAEAAHLTIQRSGLSRARVRVTLTGGDLNLLLRAGAGHGPADPEAGSRPPGLRPTLLIVAQPATEYPEEMFERGVGVTIADARVSPLVPTEGHKTLNYWWRLRELQQAAARRAGEALVFQVSNHLVGGCVSNALIVKGGRLLTPIARGEEGAPRQEQTPRRDGGAGPAGVALPSPVRPGVTRAWVRDWACQRGLEVLGRMLSIGDVLDADEVFLTNSSWGVLPVVKIEREAIADAAVGAITRAARNAWLESLEEP